MGRQVSDSIRSSIVSHLRECQLANPMTGLAIFYCDGNCREKKETRYILGSILRQLLPSLLDPGSPRLKHIEKLFHDHKDTSINLTVLSDSILWFSKFFDKVYIVVDGLDECSRGTEVCAALSILATGNVKVLTTSRPDVDIVHSFCQMPQLDIDSHVRPDIETYIDRRFVQEDGLRCIKSSMKSIISQNLLSQSSGV